MRLLAGVLLGLSLAASPAAAQEPSSGTTTTLVEVPSQDIIPTPGEGEAPDEAGDRGGALQLAVLALVLGGIAAVVLGVVRQSRRARGGSRPL